MRTNLSVTQQEFDFPANSTLMSTTDVQSHIIYANQAFIQARGFDSADIMGQPHNVVRHPDMPAQAFANMWETLKSGLSRTALVKNRRSNGNHYWARANATPDIRNGQTVCYMSVRTLARRSSAATREIAALINDSVTRTAAGGERVGKAGDAMRSILAQVSRVTDLINEISAATKEQSPGISHANTATTPLDPMTQQNASLVHESAEAAENLQVRTRRQVEAVVVFRSARH